MLGGGRGVPRFHEGQNWGWYGGGREGRDGAHVRNRRAIAREVAREVGGLRGGVDGDEDGEGQDGEDDDGNDGRVQR